MSIIRTNESLQTLSLLSYVQVDAFQNNPILLTQGLYFWWSNTHRNIRVFFFAGLRHHRTRRPGCVEVEVRPLERVTPLGSGQGSGQWAVIQALPFVQSYVKCGWGP